MKYKMMITSVFAALIFVLVGCTGKPDDTIAKFAAAVNDNNASAAGKLITSTAANYNALENNNWSGMSTAIGNWRIAGTIGFTSLSDDVSGSDATVKGTYTSTGLGNSATVFKLVKESDFLFFAYSWKIKDWQYGTDMANGTFQINKFIK